MNLSSHVFLPIKWKLGQYRLDGTVHSAAHRSLTHWFPVNTEGHTLYLLEPNAVSLYGPTYCFRGSSPVIINNFAVISTNSTIFDGVEPILPSKPFTYILIN